MSTPTCIDNYYIISDLHMSEGMLPDGTYLGTENFFADAEFSDFIDHIIVSEDCENKTLIINGDFTDFIRQAEFPKETNDFSIWRQELLKVGVDMNLDKSHVKSKEETYGLKSNDYKSVWKLYTIIRGHRVFFEALSRWLDCDNSLIILAGNHDQEWVWPLVQKYLRVRLCELSGKANNAFDTQITFEENHKVLHNKIWVEHGNNFEKTTKFPKQMILDENKPDREKQLAWPFGNFFNRYIINHIEKIFPYANNLKSSKPLFQAILDEDLSNSLKILAQYSWYLFYMVKKFFGKMILGVILRALVTIVPLLLAAFLAYDQLNDVFSTIPKFENTFLNILKTISPFLLRYVFKWVFSMMGLTDKPLFESGYNMIHEINKDRSSNIEYLVFGHNHKGEKRVIQHKGKEQVIYLNSGSWTGSYELKFKKVKLGIIYGVVKLKVYNDNTIEDWILQWDKSTNKLITLPSFSN